MITFVSLAVFHARQLLRIPFFVQLALMTPASFILLRALGTMNAGTTLSPLTWFDATVAGLWATTTTAVGLIGYQRFQGTLEMQVFSVLRPGMVFGALTAAAAFIGVVGLPVSLLLHLVLAGGVEVSLQAIVGLVVAVFACMASAALLSALFVVSLSARAIEPIILTPIWLLVGIVVPFSTLPGWVTPFALIHPLTGAVLSGSQNSWSDTARWALTSCGTSAVWFVLAYFGLRIAITRARTKGTLALA